MSGFIVASSINPTLADPKAARVTRSKICIAGIPRPWRIPEKVRRSWMHVDVGGARSRPDGSGGRLKSRGPGAVSSRVVAVRMRKVGRRRHGSGPGPPIRVRPVMAKIAQYDAVVRSREPSVTGIARPSGLVRDDVMGVLLDIVEGTAAMGTQPVLPHARPVLLPVAE